MVSALLFSMVTIPEERLLCYIRWKYWLGNNHSQIVVPALILTYCSRAIQLTFLCICLPSCVMGIISAEKGSIKLNLYKAPQMKWKCAIQNKMCKNKKCINKPLYTRASWKKKTQSNNYPPENAALLKSKCFTSVTFTVLAFNFKRFLFFYSFWSVCGGSFVIGIKKPTKNILKCSIKWHLFSIILLLKCWYALHKIFKVSRKLLALL